MSYRSNGRIVRVGLAVALMVAVAASTGCAPTSSAQDSAPQNQMGAEPAVEMTCRMCGEGAPAVEAGSATEEEGVQVVRVTLKDGYYSPNEITLKAGMPAKLIFTGDAKDCAGKPMIADLNAQADFTESGEAIMDLETVSPGTYELTCGMGSDGGSVIVQ